MSFLLIRTSRVQVLPYLTQNPSIPLLAGLKRLLSFISLRAILKGADVSYFKLNVIQQVKNQSIIQKLLKLRRKWQATCRKLHMHTFMPVPAHSRPELSSLSRLSVVPHGMDCKPCGKNK